MPYVKRNSSGEIIEQYANAQDDVSEWIDEVTVNPQIEINKEALAYLASTGWVVEKLSEYFIIGIDVTPYLTKYADILNKRQQARDAIV